jgi:hypothetical protein
MADDKKTNLPTVKLSGPEVDRREVIRGGLATVGQALMPSLPGAIADLTLGDIVPSKSKGSSPEVLKSLVSKFLDLGDYREDMEMNPDYVIHGRNSWDYLKNALLDNFHNLKQELMKDGTSEDKANYIATRLARDTYQDYISNLDKYSKFIGYHYGEEREPQFEMLSGEELDTAIETEMENIINTAIKDYEAGEHVGTNFDQIVDVWEDDEESEDDEFSIEDIVAELPTERAKDTPEERIKDVGKTVGTHALGRLLTQLADKKDTKPKGPKQITGPKETEKPSINKLLSALSVFKRGTPLGAAAYVMGPTATAEDDDYDFEIPVDR